MGSVDPPAIATFFTSEAPRAGSSVVLGPDVARHARVLRLATGMPVRLTDGAGRVARGVLERLSSSEMVIAVRDSAVAPDVPPLHLLVPVADRDRMLWLAEKSVELGVTSWRPILWHRSRSVAGRGEGKAFAAKIVARMTGALTQSGGAWLPAVRPEASLGDAVADAPEGTRILLERGGEPLARLPLRPPITIAIGPEGGIDAAERAALVAAGFTRAALSASILRFETAGVAALAVVHARLDAMESSDG